MPANFITAGWGFSTFTLILAAALTIIAAKLLIETREKLGGNLSYPDIGMKLYGTKGRVAVEVSIVGSQFTLVAAYIYFIAFTLQSILFNAFAITISKWAFGALCFAIYTPLCLVRDMATLASTHLFGDIMIILTVLSIMTYAFLAMGEPDSKTANEPFINTTLFPNAFGFSVFAYCGMGTVLPTYDMTADKKNYFKVLCYVCITIMVIYIVFPLVCINAYGVYNGRLSLVQRFRRQHTDHFIIDARIPRLPDPVNVYSEPYLLVPVGDQPGQPGHRELPFQENA